jgi:hypothetical protein
MNSPALTRMFKSRQIWVLAAAIVALIVVGFFAVPDFAAIVFVSKAGFWIVLAAFAIFLHALWSTYRESLRSFDWRATDWTSLGVVGVAGMVLLAHESSGFKILMDEIMLLGTSMSMHLDRLVQVPIRGSDIQGSFAILEGLMDKRPLFFPFLVSLLHDLTGYRPENAFVLNGLLTFVFLGLVNRTGQLLGGRLAGWIGVVLFAGLPLLAHNATGGGFELLNLVMILSTVLLGVRFLEIRDGAALTAFCFSGILLAQVRYESVIYLLPVALIVLWVWSRERRPVLSWPVVFGPLLMIHYPMQHRIFDLRASAWELGSQPGYQVPFSPAYIADNLAHAATFFFGRPGDQPSSLVFSALGCLAIPFFVLLVLKRLRRLGAASPADLATTAFAVGFALQFALLMCYFWGRFDDVVIRRLSLPTHLAMMIAIAAVLPQFRRPAVGRSILGLAALGLLASGIPSMAAHAYSQEYLPGKETAWRREFIAERPRRDYIVIDNDSVLWIAHQISSTPVLQAIKHRDRIIWNMRNRTFSDILVYQRFNIDPETGQKTLREGDDLGPDFVLETVQEERLQTLTLSRISRLKEIREGETSLTAADSATHPVPTDRAEIERRRREYLENFLRMLP